ncbi:MAG: hypothetical protein JSS81_04720 [Acidobacteria bacterium]|nr:hypothetical protein [Acidobacteriota bacterium]
MKKPLRIGAFFGFARHPAHRAVTAGGEPFAETLFVVAQSFGAGDSRFVKTEFEGFS